MSAVRNGAFSSRGARPAAPLFFWFFLNWPDTMGHFPPDQPAQEALRRDPGDARVNTVLGITDFKKARYADAEKSFRKALERLTDRYTAPKDGEATHSER